MDIIKRIVTNGVLIENLADSGYEKRELGVAATRETIGQLHVKICIVSRKHASKQSATPLEIGECVPSNLDHSSIYGRCTVAGERMVCTLNLSFL